MFCFVCNIFACLRSFIFELFSVIIHNQLTLFVIAASFAITIILNIHWANQLCDGICFNSANTNNNQCDFDNFAEQNVCDQEEEPMGSRALQPLNCKRGSLSMESKPIPRHPDYFDYSFDNGPHTWRAAKNNQSPINIEKDCAEVQIIHSSLEFLHFDDMPLAVQLENNGRTFKLRACFSDNNKPPIIGGGELLSCYKFVEMSFRWGLHDTEGSEHSIDNVHYPLELQALYFAGDNQQCASSYELLMLSYFYDIAADNPFLDAVIPYLVCIQEPNARIEIPPFPLSYLMPPFKTNFYSYEGSQTEPPCHRGVEWYISPEPMSIGARQLSELRQLRGCNGMRITSNSRPVQPLDNRTVYLNKVELDCSNTKRSVRLTNRKSSSYCGCSTNRCDNRNTRQCKSLSG